MTNTGAAVGGHALVPVQIIDLPVALHVRASEHTDGLRREFRLLAEYQRQEGTTSALPTRLVEMMQGLSATYGGFTSEQRDLVERAIAEGRESLTLTLRVPVQAADAARALGAILDEADEYCRAGDRLLTLAAPPDVVAYRRWYLQQFVDQLAGAPPRPFRAAAQA